MLATAVQSLKDMLAYTGVCHRLRYPLPMLLRYLAEIHYHILKFTFLGTGFLPVAAILDGQLDFHF